MGNWIRTIIVALAFSAHSGTSAGAAGLSAIWANDGGDKVAREELRAAHGGAGLKNRTWDGQRIRLFGARNEVLGLALILEAAEHPAVGVSVRLESLVGPDGAVIGSKPAGRLDGLFRWTDRQIELFFVRYLRIAGLSRMAYDLYDERHIPERLRLPESPSGTGHAGWSDRPDHDRSYPDIAVPLEAVGDFGIEAGASQSVWADIYIPKDALPGRYAGVVAVSERDGPSRRIPVELDVLDFALPDVPASKTMLVIGYEDIARRYTGVRYPLPGSDAEAVVQRVIDRHFLLAHRHKISLIGANVGATPFDRDEPRPEWRPRLDGTLFSAANGYAGPGTGVGIGVFAIGLYGSWREAWGDSLNAIWAHGDAWESWFRAHQPDVERFLYLADESHDFDQLERWASLLKRDPGEGRNLRSMATLSLPNAERLVPSLDIVASSMAVGERSAWKRALDTLRASGRKRFFMYSGQRPASGSFATDDEGVALRELPWGQYKKGIDRWFAWQGTYYNDYQGGRGEIDLFSVAQTFGGPTSLDQKYGLIGWNSSNGDGVLFYPGTDRVFPSASYGLEGPIASLRLKYWRRGIQDVDYITLATKIDPASVQRIVERMVPRVLWENGVGDPADPTWVRCPISWSTDPDTWEAARRDLADIILTRNRTP